MTPVQKSYLLRKTLKGLYYQTWNAYFFSCRDSGYLMQTVKVNMVTLFLLNYIFISFYSCFLCISEIFNIKCIIPVKHWSKRYFHFSWCWAKSFRPRPYHFPRTLPMTEQVQEFMRQHLLNHCKRKSWKAMIN